MFFEHFIPSNAQGHAQKKRRNDNQKAAQNVVDRPKDADCQCQQRQTDLNKFVFHDAKCQNNFSSNIIIPVTIFLSICIGPSPFLTRSSIVYRSKKASKYCKSRLRFAMMASHNRPVSQSRRTGTYSGGFTSAVCHHSYANHTGSIRINWSIFSFGQ